jgi:hypothetical protein
MDVLRRVRWGNVGRALAVVAAIGVLVAWPKLASDAPRVPTAAPSPLDRGPYYPRKTRPMRPTVARSAKRSVGRRNADRDGRARRDEPRRRRAPRQVGARRRAARREGARPATARRGRRDDARGVEARDETVTTAPRVDTRHEGATAAPRDEGETAAPPETPAPSDPDPVGAEFGFETSGP